MRVLYAGTPATAVAPLEALLADATGRIEVVGVLTREDAPVGRKRVLTPSPVAARAEELGLPVIRANRYDDAAHAAVTALAPEAAAVVAYGAILPERALEAVPKGWINLHYSDLPRWRGAAPVQRALMAGERELTACTFRIERGLDTGPVYHRLTEPVGSEDDAGTMLERLSAAGGPLLARTLGEIAEGTDRPTPQEGEPITAAKLTAEQARIDWQAPSEQVAALVRGTTPEPGAWTTLEGQRVKVAGLVPVGASSGHRPGTVRLEGQQVLVSAGDGDLRLGRIQPAGKKMMAAPDWARGSARLDEGSVEFA
ncbi:methionyl-tRNA formyltransferase [Amycolatopsis sp. H6(2020)]|nr:methionyl-tRNA formyltransferase [Amycolatopsis sp. H6(2020)]